MFCSPRVGTSHSFPLTPVAPLSRLKACLAVLRAALRPALCVVVKATSTPISASRPSRCCPLGMGGVLRAGVCNFIGRAQARGSKTYPQSNKNKRKNAKNIYIGEEVQARRRQKRGARESRGKGKKRRGETRKTPCGCVVWFLWLSLCGFKF